jgi:hypothetical protein
MLAVCIMLVSALAVLAVPAIGGAAPRDPSIWVDRETLRRSPTSGRAWESVVKVADSLRSGGRGASIRNQDSKHDQAVLAAALVCARTGLDGYCSKARAGVLNAIGTEDGARWLAVGRNLAGYVIAADLLGLRADGRRGSDGTRVQSWIASFLTRTLRHNNGNGQIPIREAAWASGSNAAAQQGFAHAAVAAYLGDRVELAWAWARFRTFACDSSRPVSVSIQLSQGVEGGWAHDRIRPCAVNPEGAVREGTRIDGAIINDMARGGRFRHPPRYTQYPWVGLEGFVPAALVLHRAGFPAFAVADEAVRRSVDYLWYLRRQTGDEDWFNGRRAAEVVHLTNVAYGTTYPVRTPVGPGRTVGFTDWTHRNGL